MTKNTTIESSIKQTNNTNSILIMMQNINNNHIKRKNNAAIMDKLFNDIQKDNE